MSFRTLLIAYVFGGLTFIPLVLLAGLAFAYFTLPRVPQHTGDARHDESKRLTAQEGVETDSDDGYADKKEVQGTSGTDAAGYFAVCREYVPGGVNGKPPERSSPAGEVLNAESPSVYQSMYRSIFDRGKTPSFSLEGDKKDPKAVKRPRNVFFVVLRHEHLLLFDNADQLEVRHVISLLHHNVDVFGEDEELTDDELWIKRNCIRLTRRSLAGHAVPTSQPFYIFSDNCSDKEDFYYALLAAQAKARDGDAPPSARHFDMDHIIKLVQTLHTSDADIHLRWLNALFGRLFLAVYRTEETQTAIKKKLNRKISQAPKPNFIVSVQVQKVDMGDAAPTLSNFKLKELMVDGTMTVETDIKYNGGFRLQIAAVARIDLGSRIRAREVDLLLAGHLRKMSGHLLIKIKPPPSNRFWFSFETMPNMDLSVEPVVSSMQITYSVILRAIESRIRETIGETLVLPNWDDAPFFDTRGYEFRGGIWDAAKKTKDGVTADTTSEVAQPAPVAGPALKVDTAKEDLDNIPPLSPKTMSMPSLLPSPTKDTSSRKTIRKAATMADMEAASTSISTSSTPMATPPRSRPTSPRITPADRPKAMRSNSFAAAATPLVSTDGATSTVQQSSSRKTKGHRDAADFVKEVKSRSDSMSTQQRPASDVADKGGAEETVDASGAVKGSDTQNLPDDAAFKTDLPVGKVRGPAPSATFPLPDTSRKRTSWNLNLPGHQPGASGSALERAGAAAKSWGISMMNRQTGTGRNSVSGFTSLAKEAGLDESAASSEAQQAEKASEQGKVETEKGGDVAEEKTKETAVVLGRGQLIPQSQSANVTTENANALQAAKQAASLWSTSPLNIATFKRKPISSTTSTSAPSTLGTKSMKPTSGRDLPPGLDPDAPEGLAVGTGHHRRKSSLVGGIDMDKPSTERRRSSGVSGTGERRVSHARRRSRAASGALLATEGEEGVEGGDVANGVHQGEGPQDKASRHLDDGKKTDFEGEGRGDVVVIAAPLDDEEEQPPPLPARGKTVLDPEHDAGSRAGGGGEDMVETGTVDTAREDEPAVHKEEVQVREPNTGTGWHSDVVAAVEKGGKSKKD